jgi:glycine C-acetyltransferase
MKMSNDKDYTLFNYYSSDAPDIFTKCSKFTREYDSLDHEEILSKSYRVNLSSGLDTIVSLEDGRKVLCFDSNGYLGLQHHPIVKEAMKAAIDTYGCGTPSVPLLGGTNELNRSLEKTIAKFHGREDAILFSSAYAANIGVAPALIRRGDIVFYDKYVHASVQEGIKLSKCLSSKPFSFNNPQDLKEKMKAARDSGHKGGIIVFTDGVFSMEGVVLKLPEISEACKEYGARLIVDECHSVGVLGKTGRGVEEHFDKPHSCDLITGCFSKAFGFSGGYIVGDRDVINYLRFFSPSYIFSTSLPAPLCAGIKTAIDVLVDEPHWIKKLRDNSLYMRKVLKDKKIDINDSESSIIKISIPGNKTLFGLGKELLDSGLKCGIVTFPAVRDNKGMLRIVVTARHDKDQIDQASEILANNIKPLH